MVVKNMITNQKTSHFIFSKSKVKPKRNENLKIHLLELLGALIGVQALKFMQKELNKANIFFNKLHI